MTEELFGKIDEAILFTDWSRLDSHARRARRRRYISSAMESILLAEAHLQQALSGMSLDLGEDGLEATVPIGPVKTHCGSAKEAIARVFASGTDREKYFGHLLTAKAALIEADWTAGGAALEHIDEEAVKRLILSPIGQILSIPPGEGGDTDTLCGGSGSICETSLPDEPTGVDQTASFLVLERLLAVQSQWLRGLCLEFQGRSQAALSAYVVITAGYRERPFERLWRQPAFEPFIGLAMYRYGLLCAQLEKSCDERKDVLMHDAGIALRMYLTFTAKSAAKQPLRRISAMQHYAEALEARFQRQAFCSAFTPEQWTPSGSDQEAPFVPESVEEDLLLVSLLLEVGHAEVESSKDPERSIVQSGATCPRQRLLTRRLARMGCTDMIRQQQESLAERYAGNATLYGSLVLSYSALGAHEKTCLAGEIYHKLGGKDRFVLLSYAKAALRFGYNTQVISLLEAEDSREEDEMTSPIKQVLAAAYLLQAQENLPEKPGDALQLREKAVQLLHSGLISDPDAPSLHKCLSLAYYELDRLPEAERAIKAALARDASNAAAWYLLALLRTAAQEHEAAVEICDIQLDQAAHPHLETCIIKALILGRAMGRPEEAVELIRAAFAHWVIPAEATAEAPTGSEEDERRSSMTIRRFKHSFMPVIENSCEPVESALRFSAVADRFPQTPDQVRADLLDLPAAHARQLPVQKRIQALQEHFFALCGQEGKRFGTAKHLWLLLARLLTWDRKLGEAKLAADIAFSLDELDPDVYYRLGRLAEAQGVEAQAMTHFQRGLLLRPDHLACNLAMSRRLFSANPPSSEGDDPHRLNAALGHAQAALRASPSDYRPLGLMAQIHSAMGHSAQAKHYFRLATEAEDMAPIVPISLSYFLFTD